jgi:hypothetical protein
MHGPGKAADRLDVDDALPAAVGGVLHVVVDVDNGGQDGRAQLELALEGRVQVDLGGRVGRVRFELEDRVGRLLRKVDRERRVGRMRADDEKAARLVLVRGDQSEFGCNRAVRRAGKKKKRVIRIASYVKGDEKGLTRCWI